MSIIGGDVYESVPPQEITLDSTSIFSDKDFEFYSSNPDIRYEQNVWDYCYAVEANGTTTYEKHYSPKVITYSGSKPSEPSSIPGIFTMTWRDCGIDADGDRIDICLIFSNITFRYNLGGKTVWACPADESL